MRVYTIGGFVRGLVLTAIIAAGGWFLFGQDILDDVREANERAAGAGPFEKRMVSPARFAPIVAELRRVEGPRAPMVTVVMRADSVEFILRRRGRLRGYRWRRNGPLRQFDAQATADPVYVRDTWPLSRLDVRSPARVSRRISAREGGDFLLTLADFGRTGSGRLAWVMRGRVGERGVAWFGSRDGRRVAPYNPASPAF